MSFALATVDRSIRSGLARVNELFNKACLATVAGLALSTATSATWAQAVSTKPTSAKQATAAKGAQSQSNRMDTSLHGVWRVSRGELAPWVPATDKGWNTKSWIGQTIRFEPNRVVGPESLRCSGVVNYEATNYPADALFQGGLPTPAAKAVLAATNLGFVKLPARGTSLNCDAGLFEFHQVDATTELVAINNVIWTLDRSPGALAEATTPSGVMQRFLEAHFAGDMGFDAATVAAKRQYLSTALFALMKKYFAKPVPKDEVPDIDGDPFTNSQDYPARFSVGAAATTANSSTVRVKFSDAHYTENVTFLLTKEGGAWRVDDVRYNDNSTLRTLLSGSPK